MNTQPIAAPTATIAAETTGLSPCTALSAPEMTRPIMLAHITAPSTSNGSLRGCGAGSARPRTRLMIAKGTALANTHGQGAIPSTSPPKVGASAAELDTTTELMPRPRPSCDEG
ncbi:hypothetical protein WR25_04185 [Diploscapter pachys]|uniref:Uncharacterized protein n=1 Tax=Diploscapter pachys TaxID=2018661 RepID=A0A2A2K3W5_9BILA|nr:hypothetical protein WR25_04185 [Diploscapter pachys]